MSEKQLPISLLQRPTEVASGMHMPNEDAQGNPQYYPDEFVRRTNSSEDEDTEIDKEAMGILDIPSANIPYANREGYEPDDYEVANKFLGGHDSGLGLPPKNEKYQEDIYEYIDDEDNNEEQPMSDKINKKITELGNKLSGKVSADILYRINKLAQQSAAHAVTDEHLTSRVETNQSGTGRQELTDEEQEENNSLRIPAPPTAKPKSQTSSVTSLNIKTLQKLLGIAESGTWGPETDVAWKKFWADKQQAVPPVKTVTEAISKITGASSAAPSATTTPAATPATATPATATPAAPPLSAQSMITPQDVSIGFDKINRGDAKLDKKFPMFRNLKPKVFTFMKQIGGTTDEVIQMVADKLSGKQKTSDEQVVSLIFTTLESLAGKAKMDKRLSRRKPK